MRTILSLIFISCTNILFAQHLGERLSKEWDLLMKDPQMKHAVAAFTVVDGTTGKLIFDRNGEIGLAPASTQKIITSIAAFEYLGPQYRYKTIFGYSGIKQRDSLNGYLFWKGSGDPSLGSARFEETKSPSITSRWIKAVQKEGIKKLPNEFFVDQSAFDAMPTPGGWIVDDIGNYYGAAAHAFNWRENQFDIQLRSGKNIGDRVEIVSVNGEKSYSLQFDNRLKSAVKGSGDNAYIYLPLEGYTYVLKGTIPVEEANFEISGAVTHPTDYFIDSFRIRLEKEGMINKTGIVQYSLVKQLNGPEKVLDVHYSPSLDSLNYWFLRKSINLYGEAFLKTIALEKAKEGSTEKGIKLVKTMVKNLNIDVESVSIIDGSGLSLQNRVTSKSFCALLQFARSKSWFASFMKALPEFNGMKMKSGYISGVRSFCGYHQAKNGASYSYSIMVNNFSGSSAEITKKIYKLLDYLK